MPNMSWAHVPSWTSLYELIETLGLDPAILFPEYLGRDGQPSRGESSSAGTWPLPKCRITGHIGPAEAAAMPAGSPRRLSWTEGIPYRMAYAVVHN